MKARTQKKRPKSLETDILESNKKGACTDAALKTSRELFINASLSAKVVAILRHTQGLNR